MVMRRSSATWEQNYALRLRFERPAFVVYPNMSRTAVGHRQYARVVYRLVVPVPEYEPRTLEFQFRRTTSKPQITRVYADGPSASPHRYAPHPKDPLQRASLCIWYPDDPPEQRWVSSNGLLSLVELTRVHLYKEAYWRETGEWLGEQVPHDGERHEKAC